MADYDHNEFVTRLQLLFGFLKTTKEEQHLKTLTTLLNDNINLKLEVTRYEQKDSEEGKERN